jgi:hypothetical protein
MRYLPRAYRQLLGELPAYAITGLTIGALETYIVNPLDRLKVWKMTVPVLPRI